jgi:hypothetical protein
MPKVSTKEAVAAAKDAMKNLYDDSPLQGLALEEIELIDAERHQLWAVTLGFDRPGSVGAQQGAIGTYLQSAAQIENRAYKTIYIDATSGEFVKMEIRPTP